MRKPILVLLLTATPAVAYKPVPPKRHDVFSHHRMFVLDVNPATQVHTVYDVQDQSRPLWSFSEPIGYSPCLLSDDGQVVATFEGMHVQEKDIAEIQAVTFWNKDGQLWSYPLRDLCPDPPLTLDVEVLQRLIGGSWRTWFKEVEDHGDSFTLRTTCGVEYRFRYADGALLSRQRFALSPKSKVAAGVLILAYAAAVVWYGRRRLAAQAADRQRLITQAADWPPAPEHRDGIQASRPSSHTGIRPNEPGLPRLDVGRPARMAVRWRVLRADTGAIVGLLLGAFLGGLLGLLVGNGWDMLEWGIRGSWIGGCACAVLFAILAWKDRSLLVEGRWRWV